ncbi:hypothetical protein NIES4073_15780 [Kalymmatonema gypsitolerans NIES-4073]|nr:hypothetical protein NIES4073_15780 [Scytonema sp. NIES-4073]
MISTLTEPHPAPPLPLRVCLVGTATAIACTVRPPEEARHATRMPAARFALTPVAWAWETRLQRAYSPQAVRGGEAQLYRGGVLWVMISI